MSSAIGKAEIHFFELGDGKCLIIDGRRELLMRFFERGAQTKLSVKGIADDVQVACPNIAIRVDILDE